MTFAAAEPCLGARINQMTLTEQTFAHRKNCGAGNSGATRVLRRTRNWQDREHSPGLHLELQDYCTPADYLCPTPTSIL